MTLNVENLGRVSSPEDRLLVAAYLYKGYQTHAVSWRIAHSVLRRYGVPSDAITQGLHSTSTTQVPVAIRSYLEV